MAYIIRETAKGLKYLHESNLIHRYLFIHCFTARDVKAGNILVDENGNIRLGDLGVARLLEGTGKKQEARTFVGTPCWMAPEVMNRNQYDSRVMLKVDSYSQADIWSLGITALELFKGIPPLAKFEPMEILIRTVQGDPPSFSSYTDNYPVKPSSAFVSWVSSVLKKDPSQRYTAEKVLSHRWMSLADQGKESLLELLKTVPDLQGHEETQQDLLTWEKESGLRGRSEVQYVKNTTWNFSLPLAWESVMRCRSTTKKEGADNSWLGKFNDVSVKETEVP